MTTTRTLLHNCSLHDDSLDAALTPSLKAITPVFRFASLLPSSSLLARIRVHSTHSAAGAEAEHLVARNHQQNGFHDRDIRRIHRRPREQRRQRAPCRQRVGDVQQQQHQQRWWCRARCGDEGGAATCESDGVDQIQEICRASGASTRFAPPTCPPRPVPPPSPLSTLSRASSSCVVVVVEQLPYPEH